jgi:signal peptidase I
MTRDKKILYIMSAIPFAALLAVFFINIEATKVVTALLITALAAATRLLVKKRSPLSINKREVLLLSIVMGAIYVIVLHMTGIFFGYYNSPYIINARTIFVTIVPVLAIIIASEILRSTLLAQSNKIVSVLAFLSCLMAELLIFSNVAGITSFNKFMDLIGLTMFPAISANCYYHYASRRFGAIPNIAFRIITTMYVYVIPTHTGMADAILSMIKLALPIIMYALVSGLFEKKKKVALQKGAKLSALGTVLASVAVVSIAMLISCQFSYGAIVIATESMTGEINKGDIIIYEEYTDQTIKEGQVIVFLQNNNRIIHRVVRIENIGGEIRYYTRGDANESEDRGYRTDADIVGLTDIKLAYLGYPTLWLREIIDVAN